MRVSSGMRTESRARDFQRLQAPEYIVIGDAQRYPWLPLRLEGAMYRVSVISDRKTLRLLEEARQ